MDQGSGTGRWVGDKLGFLVSIDGEDLVLRIDEEFLETAGVGHWAKRMVDRYPGPYRRLVIDCSGLKDFKSTFFAELLHLRDAFAASLRETALIRGASPRMKQLMQVMAIVDLFAFDD